MIGARLCWPVRRHLRLLMTTSTPSSSSDTLCSRVLRLSSYTWRGRRRANYVFTVASVTHKQKWTRGVPTPHSSCHFPVDITVLFSELWRWQFSRVHQCETSLVLTAVPELNTFTIKSGKMMMIMPSHLASPVGSSEDLCLTSWVHYKLCWQHLNMHDELYSS